MFICLFACLFVCLFLFYFFIWVILEYPQKIWNFHEDLTWFGLNIVNSQNIFCLFVCLFVCWPVFFILIILGHPQEYTLKMSQGSKLIWLRYSGSKKCLFVCLFVYLFVDLFVFYFNHLGTPTGIYPENFVKIRLDLAEIYRM